MWTPRYNILVERYSLAMPFIYRVHRMEEEENSKKIRKKEKMEMKKSIEIIS